MELYDSKDEDEESEDTEERFSDNVLLIEITGSQFQNFSIVDLPALMHSEFPTFLRNGMSLSQWLMMSTGTPNQQDDHYISIIRDLIVDYMSDQRTVIL